MRKFLFIVLFSLFALASYSFEITISNDVRLDNNSKILATDFGGNFLLYAFAKDNIAGWNGPLFKQEAKYIEQKYLNLPYLGGWYGNGLIPNKEVLLKANLDAIFLIDTGIPRANKILPFLKELNIPAVSMQIDSMSEYYNIFIELGKILHKEEKGRATADYVKRSLDNAERITSQIPNEKRKRVYLALEQGLFTVCSGSVISETLQRAGAINIHECKMNKDVYAKSSLEQIFKYNPNVIIAVDKKFYNKLFTDKVWSKLPAVEKGNVILVPDEPFRWIDRTTFMRFLALQYLACKLYPDRCDIDLEKEATAFFDIFLQYELTPENAHKLMNPTKYDSE